MGCVAEDGWLAKEDTNRGRKKNEKKESGKERRNGGLQEGEGRVIF